ncbi:MAG: F0F1 ATP synthase subunit B [Phycisphaerae bacterium]
MKRTRQRFSIALLGLAALSFAVAPARRTLAAESAAHGAAPTAEHAVHGEGAGGPSILSGDIGNVFWTLAIFAVLLVILRATAWGPIRAALQRREQFILDSLSTAKKEREDSQRLLAEYTRKLDQARADASAIVEEGKRDAEAVRKRINDEARAESAAMLERAKRELSIARDDAVKQLYQQSVELAALMAGKLVKKQLSVDDQRGLLNDALAELGSTRN